METQTKPDVYRIVTERILAQLQAGTVPWKQPWREAGVPQNFITGRPYRGINLLLLGWLGYEQNVYLTYEQAQGIGATVKRGEKGHLVVFWKKKGQKPEEETKTEAETTRPKIVLRYYTVFNVSQCHGIPKEKLEEMQSPFIGSPIEECEAVVNGMPNPPTITHGGPKACYLPRLDEVQMPNREDFFSMEAYYAILFHELVHSTGHESRLSRSGVTEPIKMRSESYSFEELVAEIGTSFLTCHCGIQEPLFENNVAYIQNWLRVLNNEPRWIISAAGQAQKAVDYILNLTPPSNVHPEETPPQS